MSGCLGDGQRGDQRLDADHALPYTPCHRAPISPCPRGHRLLPPLPTATAKQCLQGTHQGPAEWGLAWPQPGTGQLWNAVKAPPEPAWPSASPGAPAQTFNCALGALSRDCPSYPPPNPESSQAPPGSTEGLWGKAAPHRQSGEEVASL